MNALVRDFFVAFLLIACASARAATILAPTLSPADVQAALNQAQAGDTVVLPAGSANWTTGVSRSVPPNVTLMGAGTSATGGGDQTVITDNYASGQSLLRINVSSTGVFRLTGITVRSGSGSIKDGGTIAIGGPGNARIDHCHFIATSSANYKIIQFGGDIRGVLDHCILDLTGLNALYFYNGRSGAGESQGNYEWTQPTAFGSADFFYIEDNIINGNVSSGAYSTRIWDGFTAAKVVARFNTLSQSCLSETHATGHAPNDRGTRAQEAYGNLITSSLAHDPNYVLTDLSSGCALVWGNDSTNGGDGVYKNIYVFNVTRKNNATYGQTATPNGWGYAGTAFNGTGSNWDGGTYNGTSTTNGYPCIDQPGRGAGDLLTGNFPSKVNNTTGTIAWPNQALEPIYIWNNTGSIVSGWGGAIYSNNSGGRVVANRDYYPEASGIQTSPSSPFNGTSGTGWGTLANRPTTATPGVAYFATDQGSWNTSSSNPYGVQRNGADGVLYKCTAPNTWTLYYTPYTYPHPLQTGGAPAPIPLPTPPASATPTPELGFSVTSSISSGSTLSGSNVIWTASVQAPGKTITKIEFFIDGILKSTEAQAPYQFNGDPNGRLDTITLSNGAHVLAVRATASDGSVANDSATVTVSNGTPPATATPLPEGDNGIAARFPGDAGIASDPAVIFADDFESYGSSAGLTSKWTQAYQATNIRIATESGSFFGGSKALEFTVPQQSAEGNANVAKQLNPEQDVLFLRYYSKFDGGYNALGSSHNGGSISSRYSSPGVPADGYNKFLVNYETARFETTLANPGKLGVYIYHPDQRDLWGDFFFPTGVVSPFTAVPSDFGPGFVARPDVIPQLGRWYCYEIMVKTNTPGQRDGRIALWLDGNLIADFQNLRLRETTALKIDKFDLTLYIRSNTLSVARKWYDNVVAARAYIGPVSSAQPPSPTQAPSPPTGLRVVE